MPKGGVEEAIIGLYNRDISSAISINEISKRLKKAYPYINKKANELIKKGVLRRVIIGRSYICALNLRNDTSILLLTCNEIRRKELLLKSRPELREILPLLESARQQFRIHCILYCSGSIVFVLDYLNDKDAIRNSFPGLSGCNLAFFDRQGFKDEAIRASPLVKDRTILYSFEKYFELLQEIDDRIMLKYSPFFGSALDRGAAR